MEHSCFGSKIIHLVRMKQVFQQESFQALQSELKARRYALSLESGSRADYERGFNDCLVTKPQWTKKKTNPETASWNIINFYRK